MTDERLVQVLDALRARVREAPYQTLAVAAALGLAGGARLWRSLLGAGARLALATVVPTIIDQIQRGADH